MHGCIARRQPLLLALVAALVVSACPATVWAHGDVTHTDTPAELSDNDIQQAVASAWLSPEGALTLDAAPPQTWCGTARTTDDTTNAAYPASAPQFKIIYAYPSDRPNRFAQWAGALQSNASLASSYVSLQPGSSRAPRFDMGTSCGAQYLDLQTVALPLPRSSYISNFGAVMGAVNAVVNQTPGGPRKYFVLADTLGAGLAANAQIWGDDRPGPENTNNATAAYGFMWIPDGLTPPASGSFWPTAMLHELTHEIGAVQGSAPHTTQGFHCWDGTDLMCYNDGGGNGHLYTSAACGPGMASIYTMSETYDCDQDDYFHPAPPAGSYLDTHWNVYDSIYMGECSALATCASTPAPVATDPPVVTRTGQTLQTSTGIWAGATTFMYRWQRCQNAATCRNVAGANSTSYALTSADVGYTLRSVVTATNAGGGSTYGYSARTAAIVPPPVLVSAPVVSGTAAIGATLTSTSGTWTGSQSVSYAWQRCAGASCTTIAGESASAYAVTSADGNVTLRSVVTAANDDGQTTAASAQTAVVQTTPANTTAPSITGTTTSGATLAADRGVWTGGGLAYVYQWQRNSSGSWTDIGSATSSTYRLVSADVGATIRVRVAATNTVGSATAGSDATAEVIGVPVGEGAYQAAVASSSPVAWYRFEDAPGSTTVSNAGSAGAAMNLARTGNVALSAPGYQSGSKAAAFGGGNDYLQQSASTTNVAGTFTVEMLRSQTSAAGAPISTRQSSDLGYAWQCSATTGTGGCGQVAGTGASWLTTNGGFSTTKLDSAWHHAAAVITPTGYRTYVDGVQTASGAWMGTPLLLNATHKLTLGGTFNAGSTLLERFAGSMDEVAIYTTALSAAAIQAHAAAGGFGTQAVNTAAPTISGQPVAGSTLTADPGTWTGAVSYGYQWQRNTGASWADIAGATSTTYALAGADVGATIRVRVSAAATVAASSATATVGDLAPLNATAPSIAGSAQTGATLTATAGTWTGTSLSYAYQWQRNTGSGWTDIAGATAATYAALTADVGATIRVRVSASNPAGSATASSAASAAITAVPPANTSPPTITGAPRTGTTLTTNSGTWTNASAFTYQWQRDTGSGWADIGGATAATYTLAGADAGATIRVQVSAGGVTASSAATATVVAVPTGESAYQSAVAASSPLAWYRFDDAAGSTTVSNAGSAGAAMNLTRTGNVALSAPGYQSGSRAALFGGGNDYLQQSASTTTVSGTFTVEMLRSQTSAGGAPLSTRQSADLGYAWQCSAGATTGGCGQVVGNGSSWLTTSGSFSTTTLTSDWHHAAAVITPTGYTTYVDGVQTGSGSWSGTPLLLNATHKLTLGGTFNAGPTLLERFAGSMDEVAIYTTALSAAAIQAHATAGGFGAQPAVNTAAPTVSGQATVDSTLTADKGTWTGATSYAYQWQRNTGSSWTNIAGATSTTYVLAGADFDATIRVQVTAGSTVASSSPTASVAAVSTPVSTAAPSHAGVATSGTTLTASRGTWSYASSYAYQWQRNSAGSWTDIAGATSATYALAAGDVGATVRVQVVATNTAGSTTASSSPTPTVTVAPAGETAYHAAVSASAPLAWYTFDDAPGSATVSNSGTAGAAMNLARTGNVTLSAPGFQAGSKAAAFAGGADYLQQSASSTNVSGTFTVEMLRRQTSAAGSPFSTRQSADLGYAWQCSAGASTGGCGQVVGTGSSWLTTNGTFATAALNTAWHHAAVVITPAGYAAYVDGVQTATGTWSGTPLLLNATHRLTLGGTFNAGASLLERYTGSMDEVAIYTTALSAAAIQAHATAAGF